MLELEGELVPELLLVQICERIVPLGELWVRVFLGFEVLKSSHWRLSFLAEEKVEILYRFCGSSREEISGKTFAF